MIGYIILGIIAVLLSVILIKAAFFKYKPEEIEKLEDEHIDSEKALKHLSEAISIKTISVDGDDGDYTEFYKFHEFLERSYPLVHKTMTKEVIGSASLLFYWEGKNPELNPIALMSHMDVVPVEAGTEKDWKEDPFGGKIDREFIWGRGSLDMKNHLIAVMESLEALIEDGYQPDRGVYVCFGQDEEISIGEQRGAARIAKTLRERGVRLDCIIDEGGTLIPINVAGIHTTFATVGASEKGYADYKITVNDAGGHSSTPSKHTAIGKLGKVINRLDNHQSRAKLLPVTKEFMVRAGKALPYWARIIVGNLWFFKPLIMLVMKNIPTTATLVRTTQAATMCEGSPVPNVMPQNASAVVNCRILPGESTETTTAHLKKACGKNASVELIGFSKEPAPVSPTSSRAYLTIEKLCKQIDPKAVAVPFLVMGCTDTCYYESICDTIFRFTPFVVTPELLHTMHGTNERLPIDSMGPAVAFFKRYVKTLTKD